jgi:channel protein (hemolysin III family)
VSHFEPTEDHDEPLVYSVNKKFDDSLMDQMMNYVL